MKITYSLLRSTHLLLGLFSALFLLMYGVSAVQMAHPGWFTLKPNVVESDVAVDGSAGSSPRALARTLMADQHMSGELGSIAQQADGFTFQIVRPGTVYQVAYKTGASSAHVKTNVAGFMGMLNRVHHINGLSHEYRLLNVWGAFVGLISAGLVVLGVTGVWMWFETYGERVVGGLVFGLGLVTGLGLLILIRMQG